MDEPQELIYNSFGLYQKHLDLLSEYNENKGLAARMAFDELIQNHDKQNRQRKIDAFNNNLIIIALGLIFFIFAYSITSHVISFISLLIGIMLCIVGVVIMLVKIYALQ